PWPSPARARCRTQTRRSETSSRARSELRRSDAAGHARGDASRSARLRDRRGHRLAGRRLRSVQGTSTEFGMHRVLDTPISETSIVGAGVGAALAGARPVVDMHFADFVACAFDEVVNQAAKARYMFGGQASVPMVLRMPDGAI